MKDQWSGIWESLIANLNACVGLSNVYQFARETISNGGGSFLIVYSIFTVLFAKPLFFIEFLHAQYTSKGSLRLFQQLAPIWIGLAISTLIVNVLWMSTYMYLLIQALFYLIHTYRTSLPWAECMPAWGNYCVKTVDYKYLNTTDKVLTSAELFFNKIVLEVDENKNVTFTYNLKMVFCHFMSWFIAFLMLAGGIRHSAKYFCYITPYVFGIIILIRACTLEHSLSGILYFMKPDLKGVTPKAWWKSITYAFNSLDFGMGISMSVASFNSFRINISQASTIIIIVDTLSNVLYTVVLFAGIGHIAAHHNISVKAVVDANTSKSLLFIIYPEVLMHFEPMPQFFTILYFTMIMCIGMGSICGSHLVIWSNLNDLYPSLVHWQLSLISSGIGFIVGLIFVTPIGHYAYWIIQVYGVDRAAPFITTLKIIASVHTFGLEEISWICEFMLKRKLSWFYRFTLGITTPIILLNITFLTKYKRLEYIKLTDTCELIGEVVNCLVFLPIPIGIIYVLITYGKQGKLRQCLKSTVTPLNPKLAEKARIFLEEKRNAYPYKNKPRIVQFFYSLIKR